MKFARHSALIVCAAVSFMQVACVTSVDGDQEENGLAQAEEQLLIRNGLSMNGLAMNGLAMNGLAMNGLTMNGLTMNGLTMNGLAMNGLREPAARELLSYIVSCALPEQDGIEIDVDGTSYSFAGGLGLASEWGAEGGSCNEHCQESVSACLLARVNYLGEHVSISLRGKGPLSTTKEERDEYDSAEATYYGNVFLAEQRRFACLAPGATSLPRVCGPSLEGCVVEVVGTCDEVCDRSDPDGAYWGCHDQKPVELNGQRVFPSGTGTYRESPVSVFLE